MSSLENVNIFNKEMVQSVSSICPNLDRVVLMELDHGLSISPSDLEHVIVHQWPKVTM